MIWDKTCWTIRRVSPSGRASEPFSPGASCVPVRLPFLTAGRGEEEPRPSDRQQQQQQQHRESQRDS